MQLFHATTHNGISPIEDNYAYLHSIYGWGVFDGACMCLQGSPDGNEWFDLLSITHKTVCSLHIHARYLRAILHNAHTHTCLYLHVT